MDELLAEKWRTAIRSLSTRFELRAVRNAQRSPTFEFGQWRIAAEHQRAYRSVVIRWLGSTVPHTKPLGSVGVPPADRKKGWHFRKSIKPGELEALLTELDKSVTRSKSTSTTTWLLTWNPSLDAWDELSDVVAEIAETGFSEGRWNCGRATSVAVGDRVFLQRQGQEPRGICASGTVIREPFVDEQWNPKRPGTTHYVMVRWTAAIDPSVSPPFDARRADDPLFATVKWGTQGSGIRINPKAAGAVTHAWEMHLNELAQVERLTPEQALRVEDYIEGALERVTVNRYERDPQARAACIKHYGAKCVVCDADFTAIYGDIGRGFIEVHHLVAIASHKRRYVVDPVKDLRPVCPNCHRMLHAGSKPPSIDELRRVVEDRRRRRT